jgi:hypothetical protein
MTGEDAVNEFQEGLIANRNGGGGGGGGAGGAELDEERRRILEEREKWEKEKSEMQVWTMARLVVARDAHACPRLVLLPPLLPAFRLCP